MYIKKLLPFFSYEERDREILTKNLTTPLRVAQESKKGKLEKVTITIQNPLYVSASVSVCSVVGVGVGRVGMVKLKVVGCLYDYYNCELG